MPKPTNKKEEFIEKEKKEYTIKVKTLVIGIIWIGTVVAGLAFGWQLRSADNARVQSEAHTIVSQLSSKQ